MMSTAALFLLPSPSSYSFPPPDPSTSIRWLKAIRRNGRIRSDRNHKVRYTSHWLSIEREGPHLLLRIKHAREKERRRRQFTSYQQRYHPVIFGNGTGQSWSQNLFFPFYSFLFRFSSFLIIFYGQVKFRFGFPKKKRKKVTTQTTTTKKRLRFQVTGINFRVERKRIERQPLSKLIRAAFATRCQFANWNKRSEKGFTLVMGADERTWCQHPQFPTRKNHTSI